MNILLLIFLTILPGLICAFVLRYEQNEIDACLLKYDKRYTKRIFPIFDLVLIIKVLRNCSNLKKEERSLLKRAVILYLSANANFLIWFVIIVFFHAELQHIY
jgi:hypothetical protein